MSTFPETLAMQSVATSLGPPLNLVWSYPKAIPDPLVTSEGLVVKTIDPDGLARLDLGGRELWRREDGVYNAGLMRWASEILGVADVDDPKRRWLSVIEPLTGESVRRELHAFGLGVLLPDAASFVGVTRDTGGRDRRRITLARVSLAPGFPILWQIETEDALNKFGDADVWDSGIAYAEGCLYVGRGPYLVCLDVETGKERWRGFMEKVGVDPAPGKRWPIVAGEKVIVNGAYGVIAFDRRTGGVSWTLDVPAWKTVHGDRLYLLEAGGDRARYVVVDARSGEVLLSYPLAERLREKYAAKSSGKWRGGTGFARPAVSETHVFFGDDVGRLWAIERETGEPVWYHRPKGITGYLAATPIISGKRLYITSFSMDPKKPQALYCYEQA